MKGGVYRMLTANRVGVIRIDNKLVNPKIMGLFITK